MKTIRANLWRPNRAFFLFLFIHLFVCNLGITGGFTILENFETYGDGAFPSKWRSRSDEARKIYRIEFQDGNRFLRAHTEKQAVQIGLEYFFDPKQNPRLRWRWRAHALPVGADERVAEKHDAAAQVYVVFDNQYWPRVIKYIWSSNLPVGSRFTIPLYGRGRVVALRNGISEKNKWHQEEANFLEDYRTLFVAEPGKVQGIGILTSSDATQSIATANYDDFMLLP